MNSKVRVLMVFLVIVILGLSSFIFYDKVLMKKEVSSKKESETSLENKKIVEESFDISKKKSIQTLSFSEGYVLVSKEGDVYINFYDVDSYGHDLNELYNGSINKYKKVYKKYNVLGYRENPCDGEANIFEGIKLPISNVMMVYDLMDGQSIEGHYLYFLLSDGTVSSFGIDKNLRLFNETVAIDNNVDNLSNIVSLVQSSTVTGCSEAYQVLAIEKDGVQHVLSSH